MVNKLASISIVAGAAAISACFGAGPTPSAPSRATVLFTGVPLQACQGTYIGPVAVGAGSGYVTMLPFRGAGGQAGNNCNGGGGGIPTEPQTVFAFNEDGGSLMKIGSAGENSNDGHDQLTMTPSGVAYVYSEQTSNSTQTYVDPGRVAVGNNMGLSTPLGIAQSGSDLYVELVNTVMTNGQSEPNNPEYPCCAGMNGGGQTSGAYIWKVGGGVLDQNINPVCTTVDRCFTGNATSLIYFERPNTTGNELWRLTMLDTASVTKTKIASISNGAEVPAGLDANDTTIALSTSRTCSTTSSDQTCDVNECNVSVYDIAGGTLKTLLSTHEFGCMDAKLADGYVYFAIIGYQQHTEHFTGLGIARVSIADKTFESLDLGMRGDAAGPRRIYIDGGHLFVVDPLVMARIDATELDGKHDFTP